VVHRGDSLDEIMTRRVFCASLFSITPGLVSFAGFGNQDDVYYKKKRKAMVEIQLQARGITDRRVLDIMGKVPRHLFVDPRFRPEAYEDYPLPIAEGQTISQPYIVALMTQCLKLKGKEKVLEVGTGSGYQAAVLAHLCDRVYTVEINAALAKKAGNLLSQLGCARVEVKCGDGFFGWPDKAPFDAVIVTCAARDVPDPLFAQLKAGGRMVIPVDRTEGAQALLALRKVNGRMETEEVTPVRFVPMTGENRKIKK
jgi:protein-L-isoaspartate(D-aspartate) O-methyltransferase